MATIPQSSSTAVGHVNPQDQRVIRRVRPSSSFPGQSVYELECQRIKPDGTACKYRYGANGCDIDGAGGGRGRKCPECQKGAGGETIDAG